MFSFIDKDNVWDTDMKKVTLILCRHTQTDYNIQDRLTGQLNIPLNSVGQTDANTLALALEDRSVQAIYSSDLVRAVETARPIGLMGISTIKL